MSESSSERIIKHGLRLTGAPPTNRTRRMAGRCTNELGGPSVRDLRRAGAPPEEDARQGVVLRHLPRRLHARLPVQVLGVRDHDQRPPLRVVGAPEVAPRLARHGVHAHPVPRRSVHARVLVVEAQPGVLRRVHAGLRRPCAHRHQRLGRHPAAVPVLDAELDDPDVGLRGDGQGRQVPRRRGVLLQPGSDDGPVLVRRRDRLVARAHARVLAHQRGGGRPAHVGVVRQVPPRTWPARAVPGHVLLRGDAG